MERKIAAVYIYLNGMVGCFDQFGEQMPEYQGPKEKVLEKILADMPQSGTLRSNVNFDDFMKGVRGEYL